MAVNLPPQYHDAEEEYRRAKTPAARLEALKKMWVILPKHKASEKVQAELKTKISAAKDEVEVDKVKAANKKAAATYKFPRQGAGQYVVVGPPNAGKSRLLTRLTRATPEVAPYPFTTREPVPGMADVGDVRIQLIDTPPITADALEPFVNNLLNAADAALLVLDLGDDDGPFALEAVIDKLKTVSTELMGEPPQYPDDPTINYLRTLLVANKSDADGAADRLEIAREMFGPRFPICVIAAEPGTGLDALKIELFKGLRVMRIFTKLPGKPADMSAPYTCPIDSTVAEFATCVHRDFADTLKSARVWGAGVMDGQTVKRDHVLHDGDVVELQV
jgi:hypothetical protein